MIRYAVPTAYWYRIARSNGCSATTSVAVNSTPRLCTRYFARLHAAHRHAQQAAHPKLGHAVPVEHLAFQAELFGHAAGISGERHGRQPVGRLIGQFPREILSFGDDAPALDGCVKLRTALGHRHGKAL